MLGILGLAATCIAQLGAQSQSFPDIPENHWVYEDLARLKKLELTPEIPGLLLRGSFSWTRTDIAGFTVHAVMNFGERVDHAKDPFVPFFKQSIMTNGARVDFAQQLLKAGPMLHKLIPEFGRDMPPFVDRRLLNRDIQMHENILSGAIADWSKP